jgi:hypothetical protein
MDSNTNKRRVKKPADSVSAAKFEAFARPSWRAFSCAVEWAGMNAILFGLAIALVLFGVCLIVSREWSAQLHERWNSKFRWTRWATGPKAMDASRIANVIVGIVLIVAGLTLAVLAFAAQK